MPIGTTAPAEWRTTTDPQTGRTLRQLTGASAFSYPLYYFVDSITPDNRYFVFHSERSSWVQLYRLDLTSGEIVQLSDGHTLDSGWAIWCEHRVRGVYAHLAALNGVGREVYYFQGEELRATHLDSLDNRRVYDLTGRVPIGQSGFSPDGRHFVFIHADRADFAQALAEREALSVMRQSFSMQNWRDAMPCTIGLIDTATGDYRDVLHVPFHVHHAFFLDNEQVLINHVQGENGMWSVRIDGTGQRVLRPQGEGHGAICHNVITERGIFYEANDDTGGQTDRQRQVWIGHYDLTDDSFSEAPLPGVGYIHTGRDPAGLVNFYENQMGTDAHQLLWVHNAFGPEQQMEVLRELTPIVRGQRYHAHPFLGPERRWLYFVEVVDGFSQICALNVEDLTA
jgi:hypothetical protein